VNQINTTVADNIVKTLCELFPDGAVLHQPDISGNEWQYVKECLDTGWVSSVGSYVDKFEEMLADYTGAKSVTATMNGTAALHTCLILADVRAGDEVIIPSLTFVATANAVSYCHATPHFADINESTLGLDPVKLDQYLADITKIENGSCFNKHTGKRIQAVICMHTFGHAVNLDELVDVCKKYHLILIEDAAESLGSFYKGIHTGNHGTLSALSFNGNKIVTTGGGGAVMTNHPQLAKKAKHLTTTAKMPHPWKYDHDMVGYNYRLPNINAAIGCAQLEKLDEYVAAKRKLATKYQNAFKNVEGVCIFMEPEDSKSNYWLNVLLLEQDTTNLRDQLLDSANGVNVMTRPVWEPLHTLNMFKHCPCMELPVTKDINQRLINIPSSAGIIFSSSTCDPCNRSNLEII